MIWQAWLAVKANRGAAGVDEKTIEAFDANVGRELYKIWNRMCSGSYMAPDVKRVEIPKSDGNVRPLGIPTVADRVAQTVVKRLLEPDLERRFHPSSYGYRPGKSAHDAVRQAKANCWKYAWVVDLDIKGFFDNLDHGLMMKAVRHVSDNPWANLYIERWLKAGIVYPDGSRRQPEKGTPQGGVISPLLANLFLHFVFDQWMARMHAGTPFERYADDIICHCKTRNEAEQLLGVIRQRMADCGLSLHPEKTKLVCCDQRVQVISESANQFDFLGFTFRKRVARRKDGTRFSGFLPGISDKAKKTIVRRMREWKLHRLATVRIEDLSRKFNPQIRGWLNYFGVFYKSALAGILLTLDRRLIKWARHKYRNLLRHKCRAAEWLERMKQQSPRLFAHWIFVSPKLAG